MGRDIKYLRKCICYFAAHCDSNNTLSYFSSKHCFYIQYRLYLPCKSFRIYNPFKRIAHPKKKIFIILHVIQKLLDFLLLSMLRNQIVLVSIDFHCMERKKNIQCKYTFVTVNLAFHFVRKEIIKVVSLKNHYCKYNCNSNVAYCETDSKTRNCFTWKTVAIFDGNV